MEAGSQKGSVGLVVLVLILIVLLIGVTGFAVWAFNGRQDFKNNTAQKIAAAVSISNQALTSKLNSQFAVNEQSPYITYETSEALGSVKITYPKTWSGYETSANNPIDLFFYPGVVPDINNQSQPYALRVSVVNQSYAAAVQQFTNNGSSNSVSTSAYSFPKVPGQIGLEVTGQITQNNSGELVIMPLRSNTLEVWTEGSQFLTTFNDVILPNLTYSP